MKNSLFRNKFKKYRTAVAVVCTFTLLVPTVALGSSVDRAVHYGVTVTRDGSTVSFGSDDQPFIVDGRTFVPYSAIEQALGVAVVWDEDTQTVNITSSGDRPVAVPSASAIPYTRGTSSLAPIRSSSSDNLPNAIGATFTPGTYRVTVEIDELPTHPGRRSPMVMDVEFSENRIEDIVMVSHGETMYGALYFHRAFPMVPDLILVQQSTANVRVDRSLPTHHQAVDTFSGATGTQEMIVTAVEKAIVEAGADPLDLEPQVPTAPLPGDLFIPGSHLVHVPGDTYVFINGEYFTTDNIPPGWPEWPTRINENGYGSPYPEGPERDAAVAAGGVRDNGWSLWRYGMNAQGEGTYTGSGYPGPTVASRVMFHSPIFNRNATATRAVSNAGPTWAETQIANTSVTSFLPSGVADLITARFGTEENIFYDADRNVPTGMFLTVNFGRNVFFLAEHHSGDGLGNAGGTPISSGESLSPPRVPAPENPTNDAGRNAVGAMGPFAPDTAVYGMLGIHNQSVYGSSSSQNMGGYFWKQVAHRTINDRQSTLHVTADAYSGATQSALAVRFGVEEAMRLAGANPANITPTANPFLMEAPSSAPDSVVLVPGRYYVHVPGYGVINEGSDMMAVTLCRETIRYLGSADMNALRIPPNDEGVYNAQTREMFPDGRPEWVNGWNRFRNEILYAFARTYDEGGRQLSALDNIDPMPGAEELSENILNALRTLIRVESYNYGNIDQSARYGNELIPSDFRIIP